MNLVSEAISNIRLLKLYSWIKKFTEIIEESRYKELEALRKVFVYTSGLSFTIYTFPMLMTATVFAVYIGSGYILDL
jgi:hypothetical protein